MAKYTYEEAINKVLEMKDELGHMPDAREYKRDNTVRLEDLEEALKVNGYAAVNLKVISEVQKRENEPSHTNEDRWSSLIDPEKKAQRRARKEAKKEAIEDEPRKNSIGRAAPAPENWTARLQPRKEEPKNLIVAIKRHGPIELKPKFKSEPEIEPATTELKPELEPVATEALEPTATKLEPTIAEPEVVTTEPELNPMAAEIPIIAAEEEKEEVKDVEKRNLGSAQRSQRRQDLIDVIRKFAEEHLCWPTNPQIDEFNKQKLSGWVGASRAIQILGPKFGWAAIIFPEGLPEGFSEKNFRSASKKSKASTKSNSRLKSKAESKKSKKAKAKNASATEDIPLEGEALDAEIMRARQEGMELISEDEYQRYQCMDLNQFFETAQAVRKLVEDGTLKKIHDAANRFEFETKITTEVEGVNLYFSAEAKKKE